MFEDKVLVCKECGKEFVFTAGEQEFYAERGFQNEPQRCKPCRDARKNAARASISPRPAPCAVARPVSPSSRRATALSTAASALLRYASSRTTPELPQDCKRRPGRQVRPGRFS